MISNCCQFLAEYNFNKRQLDSANDFAHRCLHYDKTKEFGTQMLNSIKIARAEGKKLTTTNREEINRTVNTTTSSIGMSSFMKQSTPAAIAPMPNSPRFVKILKTFCNIWILLINKTFLDNCRLTSQKRKLKTRPKIWYWMKRCKLTMRTILAETIHFNLYLHWYCSGNFCKSYNCILFVYWLTFNKQ